MQEHFGKALKEDYGTRPLRVPFEQGRKDATSFNQRINKKKFRKTQCIHGHFLAIKYAAFKGEAAFITWLRNPIERLYSNYNHILRNRRVALNTIPYMVIKEGLTLEEYCFHPLVQNFCSNFFYGFSIFDFDFIGISENYDAEMTFFARKYLGKDVRSFKANVNPHGGQYRVDPGLRHELEAFHAEDMKMYLGAVELSRLRVLDCNLSGLEGL